MPAVGTTTPWALRHCEQNIGHLDNTTASTPRHARLTDGTSRRFTVAARVVREAFRLRVLRSGMTALEIGGGSLRNVEWLQRRGVSIDVVELPTVVERYPGEYERFRARGGRLFTVVPDVRFDAVISTFVLGTISPSRARLGLLRAARRALKIGGVFVLAVRAPGDVKTKSRAGRRWRDGYLTPNGTFIKPFRRPELLELCAEVGLRPMATGRPLHSNSGIVDIFLEACDGR